MSFIAYARSGGRDPSKLLFGIDHGGDRYLVPDDRDFFAVFAQGQETPPLSHPAG